MLKLTLEDYEDYIQQITIEAGREIQINSVLRQLAPRPPVTKRGRSKWPFIIGGGIAASGAAVAAYLLTNGPTEGPPEQLEELTGELTISISIP